MKLWRHCINPEQCDRSLRHEFAIGPLCDNALFGGKARLYYCIRCKWSFLVYGSRVAVLDERGNPLAERESSKRFPTFEDGPCPVLEAFMSAALAEGNNLPVSLWRKYDECSNLASSYFPARPGRVRPLFRFFGRLQQNLGRQQ